MITQDDTYIYITHKVLKTRVTEYKEGFLEHCPVPIVDGEPIMTENEWIDAWGKDQYVNAYRNGKHSLAMQNDVIDNDIME